MNTFLPSFLTVASLQFLAMVSPGPDFALVTKNALLYPRRESVYTALGIALGLSIHISYCIFGLAIVISHSLFLFNLLKYLGASYLIYIGIKSWYAVIPVFKNNIDPAIHLSTLSVFQAIQQGFLCNLLNPKAALFFLGLFTLVIKPQTPLWQQGIFGIWMVAVTFIWFSCVACFITQPKVRDKLQRIQPIVVKTLAVLLVIMGVGLLFLSFDRHTIN